jgi:hypothetical protein
MKNKLKIGWINILTVLIVALVFTACNNSGESNKSQKKNIVADSVPIDSGKLAVVANEDDSDYTKRNINLNQQQWRAFQQSYHVISPNDKLNANITGDFDGDGKKEKIFMVPPVEDTITKDAFQACIGGCNSYLVSSDSAMMILKVQDNLGGEIKNMGDLDSDGADDIMVYPSWWQSNWNAYQIYSFNQQTHQWSYLIEPVSIFANELEKKIAFVKKSKKPGFVSAYNSNSDVDGNVRSGYRDFKIIK